MGGKTEREREREREREKEERTVDIRWGHVIVLGMIPNKDFTAVHNVQELE